MELAPRALGDVSSRMFTSAHLDAHDQAAHHVARMIARVYMVLGGQRRTVERRVSQDVKVVMAVEEPVAGALRHPCHREGAAGYAAFGDDSVWWRRARVHAVHAAVAAAIDIELEPMQMHGVHGSAGIDDPKVHRSTQRVGEVLVVRPSFAVTC